MIKMRDEDWISKEEGQKALDDLAIEKGYENHADLKEKTARRRGYSGWAEFSESVQRKMRIEGENMIPEHLAVQ